MIILPIVTGLVATLRSRMRAREKWAACLMASHQMVSEIYKFRMRSGRYDLAVLAARDEDEDGSSDINPKMLESYARNEFVNAVQNLYSDAVSSEVSKGDALKHAPLLKLDCNVPDQKAPSSGSNLTLNPTQTQTLTQTQP